MRIEGAAIRIAEPAPQPARERPIDLNDDPGRKTPEPARTGPGSEAPPTPTPHKLVE